jgi:hypothetical protein
MLIGSNYLHSTNVLLYCDSFVFITDVVRYDFIDQMLNHFSFTNLFDYESVSSMLLIPKINDLLISLVFVAVTFTLYYRVFVT